MKRWGRILLSTLTAISLLLALATAGLWVRSVFVTDDLTFRGPPLVMTFCANGGVEAMIFDTDDEPDGEQDLMPAIDYGSTSNEYMARKYALLPEGTGFAFGTRDVVDAHAFSVGFSRVALPLWSVLVATSLLPGAMGLVRIRQRWRKHLGHCPACGYDLRANPARCSECGHEPVKT